MPELSKMNGECRTSVVDELDAAIRDVEEAAANWGIRRDHAEARFVAALLGAIKRLGVVIEDERVNASKREERLIAVASDLNKRGELDLAKVEAIKTAAQLCVVQAHEAIRDRELAYDESFKRQVQNIGNRMLDEFEHWRVIKESAWNFKMKCKWAVAASLVTLVVAGAGYGFREWEDRGIIDALARCQAAPDMIVQATGEGGCLLKHLAPRRTADAAEDLRGKLRSLWPFGS